MKTEKDKNIEDEKPPFFKKWSSWYFLVLGNLALMVIIFYLFTRIFE